MKSNAFRTTFATVLAGIATTLLLASCGGGGATGTPTQGGGLFIQPADATFYAGVPSRLTFTGGRTPYVIASSEPQVLVVPDRLDGHDLDVIPNNPGVVDTGLPPDALPVRTVNITMRDSTGQTAGIQVRVAQNFLTGYSLAFTPTSCPASSGGTAFQACAGGQTALQANATFNGSLRGNEQFRFQVIRGNFSLRHPVTGQVNSTITVNSDHTGSILGLIEVPAGVPTQLAVVRVIHVPTGVYADHVFTIVNTAGPISALPATITFTGGLTTQCGTGTADFLVFDGQPPYTATTTSPSLVNIVPTVSTTQPGRFTVVVTNPQTCFSAPVVVTDATGARVTINVSSEPGSVAPPTPTPFSVSPGTLTLACGATGSVSVVGGTGNYTANSNHPKVVALIFGNTVSITRTVGDGATTYPTTATISVTDGAAVQNVVATVPANCP